MAFTMACPNFKKGLKMAFVPLGVNWLPLARISPRALARSGVSYDKEAKG
jgi:hypothetical protein